MISAEEKQIGEYTYTVRQMPATQAYKMLTRLIKLAGPALKGVEGTEGRVDAIAGILGSFAERLDDKEVDSLIKELIKFVEVHLPSEQGGLMPLSKCFDTHFHGGNLSDMFKVIGAMLEVNYADFFGGTGDMRGMLAQLVASVRPSKSPTTSGGPSGDSPSKA